MTKADNNPITQELVKSNVTEAVIANLRTKYLPLKINGIDDKEGYDAVHRARIECRDIRILAEKVCKKGREDAVRIQKEWLAKEKEVVAKVQEVELYLKKQEDDIDAQKEAIKIRQERLLKLPGRKEQMKGIETYIGELTDERIMEFNDVQWNEVIVIAQGKKLAEQQRLIDEENAKKILARTIERENELIGVGARVYFSAGSKIYRKGSASIVEQTIKDCVPEEWGKIVEVFQKATIPQPDNNKPENMRQSFPVTSKIQQEGAKIAESTDEEKLFYFGGVIENLTRPVMKTDEGKKVLAEAETLIAQAITILRK